LPNGSAIDQYLEVLEEDIFPKIQEFRPELFLVSAGFDAHRLDPLSDVRLQSEDYFTLTRWVLKQAGAHASGRVVSLLEGGYHLEALADSVSEHVRALVEDPPGNLFG
jgi:acetoin utilization deacetylase AcuC-like enzyme